MARSIALAACFALLVACGAVRAEDGPASGGGPTAGPSDPAPSASASPAETALGPGDSQTSVPGAAPEGGEAASPAASPSPRADPAAAKPAVAMGALPGSMVVHEGDVVAGKSRDGKVRVMKVIKISYVEGDRLLHAIAYKETYHSWDEAKEAAAKHALTVMITHLPIDGEGLTADANRVLMHEPVTPKDLSGYKAYLKEVGQ